MPQIVIELTPTMFRELQGAAADCIEMDETRISPTDFATEAVLSCLASRRLGRIAPGKLAARMPCAEPENYHVHLPSLKRLS